MDPEQVKILAEKYISGKATGAEEELLHQWYDSIHADELEMVITPEEVNAEQFGAFIWAELADRIAREKKSPVPVQQGPLVSIRPIRSFLRLRWAAAAVLILLVGATSYFLILNRSAYRNTADTNPKQDIAAPLATNATLTLADGARIALQDARQGALAKQGSANVVKSADGALVYTVSSSGRSGNALLYNTLTVPRGSKVVSVVLADGSRVWLNAASSLRYPAVFAGNQRQVEVSGEAYFEVARQSAKPFVVKVDDMEIKVLGTHFNVHAYSDEARTTTTLLEGSVQLSKKGVVNVLKPGQQVQVAPDGKMELESNADVEQAVAWKNGMFQFDKVNLADIMRQAARWYNMDVKYEGDVMQERFIGKAPRSVNASELFALLELTKSVQFVINGNTVTVQPYKK